MKNSVVTEPFEELTYTHLKHSAYNRLGQIKQYFFYQTSDKHYQLQLLGKKYLNITLIITGRFSVPAERYWGPRPRRTRKNNMLLVNKKSWLITCRDVKHTMYLIALLTGNHSLHPSFSVSYAGQYPKFFIGLDSSVCYHDNILNPPLGRLGGSFNEYRTMLKIRQKKIKQVIKAEDNRLQSLKLSHPIELYEDDIFQSPLLYITWLRNELGSQSLAKKIYFYLSLLYL
ncbi:hypothetical protein RYD26_05130 [Pasteurellaceae bacterium LIM206]|nr:hypothetical protein [Pasteurellaceae bacterium LIM206]